MGLLHTRHKFTYDLPAVHALREKNLVSKPPVERDQVGKGAHLVAQPGIYLSGDVDVGFSDVYDADVSGDTNVDDDGGGDDDGGRCLPVMPEKARGTVGQPEGE